MDNPVGLGFFIFWLLLFSILVVFVMLLKKPRSFFSSKNCAILIILAWCFFSFLGIQGNSLPGPSLMPHRFWAIFAIPVALLCAEGFFALGSFSSKLKIPKFFVYAVIIIGILITSGYPKYVVETSYWPPGVGWGSMDELQGYLMYVKPLPFDTKVFPFCSHESKVIAFDKFAEPWDVNYVQFKKSVFNTSENNIYLWLKSRNYQYLTFDATCLKEYGMNATNQKLQALADFQKFSLVNKNSGFFLFKLL